MCLLHSRIIIFGESEVKSGNINIEQFKHLSNFKDVKEFNNHIEQWMGEQETG